MRCCHAAREGLVNDAKYGIKNYVDRGGFCSPRPKIEADRYSIATFKTCIISPITRKQNSVIVLLFVTHTYFLFIQYYVSRQGFRI